MTQRTSGADTKILVIGNNETDVRLLQNILNMNGFLGVKILINSRQAIRVYEEYGPDLLLLDLKALGVGGFDILRHFKDEIMSEYLPVIVIIEQDDMDNQLKALKMGAKDFIGKPFSNAEVITRVNNVLDAGRRYKGVKQENLYLLDMVREKTRELQETQDELIDRLLRAAEFRDKGGGDHINRMYRYAYILARTLGLSAEAAESLASAGRMHDIGKIGVPDEILSKPGKLDAPEWEYMKTHTLKGAQILGGSTLSIIRLAGQIALTHHEKWDGTGYPNGLLGTQIPLAGRIIALADVFDALISDRPYKSAWRVDEAVQYIKQQSGIHFDPEVVEAFSESLPELLKVIKESGLINREI